MRKKPSIPLDWYLNSGVKNMYFFHVRNIDGQNSIWAHSGVLSESWNKTLKSNSLNTISCEKWSIFYIHFLYVIYLGHYKTPWIFIMTKFEVEFFFSIKLLFLRVQWWNCSHLDYERVKCTNLNCPKVYHTYFED